MLELILVRHAETTASRQARYLGWTDAGITDEGERTARALRIEIAAGDTVFSSDLRRTSLTASLVLPGNTVHQDARLRELNFGVFDGCTHDENLARHGDEFRGWLADPRTVRPRGGELVTELESRVAAWLADLPAAGRVVAFAHGGSIRAAIALLEGRRTEDLRSLPVEPCCVIRRTMQGARRIR